MIVNITGVAKAALLQSLWNNAQPMGLGFLDPKHNAPLTYDEAEAAIQNALTNQGGYIGYLRGRLIKINFSSDNIETSDYDYEWGHIATAESIVDRVKTGAAVAPVAISTDQTPEQMRQSAEGKIEFVVFRVPYKAMQDEFPYTESLQRIGGGVHPSRLQYPSYQREGVTVLCWVDRGADFINFYQEVRSQDELNMLITGYRAGKALDLNLFQIETSVLYRQDKEAANASGASDTGHEGAACATSDQMTSAGSVTQMGAPSFFSVGGGDAADSFTDRVLQDKRFKKSDQDGVLYTAESFSFIKDEALIALGFSLDQVVRGNQDGCNTLVITERAVASAAAAVDAQNIYLHSLDELDESESSSAVATSGSEEGRQHDRCSIC